MTTSVNGIFGILIFLGKTSNVSEILTDLVLGI